VQLSTNDQTWVIDALQVPVTELRAVLEGGPIKIGHNLKFDWQFLYEQGVRMQPVFDTMLADQVIHHRSYGRGLGGLAKDYLDMELPKELQTSDWSGELTQEQLDYAARDAGVLPSLAKAIMNKARELELQKVIDLENQALPAVGWMKYQGVGFDLDAWNFLADQAAARVKELGATLEQLAFESTGLYSINWDSPKQVLEALKHLGVPVTNTREESLQAHKDTHPIVPLLLDYREMSKHAGTYGADWLRHLNMETGRIHPDWKQIGAETGRMACADPNLQNIPRRPEYRACFTPGPGNVLIKADYSQIEVIVAAEISNDARLLQGLVDRVDVHRLAAGLILGKVPEEVTDDERQIGKTLNFGLIYGMGPKSFATQVHQRYSIELTPEQAQEFIDKYFQSFAGLRDWRRQQGKQTITRTLTGRWRDVAGKRQYTEALNTPIQGMAADGMKLALAALWRAWTPELAGCFPVACVHDDLIIEAPALSAGAAQEWVVTAMKAGMGKLLKRAPVAVESAICQNYAGVPVATGQDFSDGQFIQEER
jgi:DNA polymerase-1